MFSKRHLAIIVGLVLGFSAAEAHAAIVDYRTLGTFTTPSLNTGGITVTGSNDIKVLNLNGLGVVDGVDDNNVDGIEFLHFLFNDGPAVDVTYAISGAGNRDGDPGGENEAGDRFLEVFAPGGSSLGIFAQKAGDFLVSALVGGVPIGSFRLTANVDSFTLRSVTFSPVPIPAALPLFASALIGLGFAARRRRAASAA